MAVPVSLTTVPVCLLFSLYIAVLGLIVLSLELIDFKTRRVAAFRKNLVELAELELKHAKVTTFCRDVPLS